MITDAQFAAWLADGGAQRVTLFEVGVRLNGAGSDTTRYLSTKYYVDSSATPYLPVVSVGMRVTETITMEGQPVLSAGDIEIRNEDGSRDSWLDDVWSNRIINVFVGDLRWPRADFRQIFSGTVIDIVCKSRDRLALRLTNKLELLNTPVTDVKVGGNATNPDALAPVMLGECHNVTPVQTNPNTLEYAYGDGANEGVIEVRTDGKPRVVTSTPTAGRFIFSAAVGPGQVTCSAQGTKYNGNYVNTIGQLVQYLVTQRGKASTRFTTSDLDTAQLATFESANTQAVGLYLTERTNVLTACQQLAGSVGAQLVPSMLGKLRLIQFAIPTTSTADILRSDQVDRTITIVNRTEPESSVKLGYCRNWTVQENLQTSLPDAHKNLYAQEWLTVTATDATVQALYKRDAEPVMAETCFLNKTSTDAEAARRLAIVKVPRTTYRFEATPSELLLELGQGVKLFSNRFGLSAGKVGLLSSRSVDWDTLRSTLEVTI